MAEADAELVMPPSADEMEDAIMEEIPQVEASVLEELFGVVGLPVLDAHRGRKNALRKALMAYLCSPSEDGGDRTEQWLLVYGRLFPNGVQPKEETTEEAAPTRVTTEVVTDAGTGEHAGLLAAANAILPQNGGRVVRNRREDAPPVRDRREDAPPVRNRREDDMAMYSAPPPRLPLVNTQEHRQQVPQQHRETRNLNQDEILITRTRLRELKLPGMIGGSSESALTFSSLEFEVKRAKLLGYTEPEIVSAIIPKIADRELRKGCELDEDLELEELMDMLRSCTAEARDSAKLFAEYSHAAQREDDTVATFISRVFRLRKEILKLGTEEGVVYDLQMLKKQGFAVLMNGIRDENIRMGVREKCAGDIEITKARMLKYAAEVVAVEAERKRRLFPKKPALDISACSVEQLEQLKQMALNTPEATTKPTKKKNPFVEIEELRTQMVGEINEIKSLILAQNSRYQENQDTTRGGGANRGGQRSNRRRPYKRCANCETANNDTCSHCWKCCSIGHKSQDCPAAARNA